MNLCRNYLIAILLLALGAGVNGQQPLKAVLLDEFRRISQEDYAARIDDLIGKLNAEPNASAYIVVRNGKVKNNRERFRYEQWAKGHLKARKSDSNRIAIIRSVDGETVKIQFWLVPAGAEKPAFVEAKWSLEIPPDARPSVWTTTEWNNGLAPPAEHLSLDLFSQVLRENPKARGNFVIRGKSRRQHSDEKSEILRILVEKFGVSQSRLRFFFVLENSPRWEYPQTEVWILP